MYEKYEELKKLNNVKDVDVSRETGINRSTFSDWKSGRSSPKIDKLKKIADFFGVSMSYFTGEKGQETDSKKGVKIPILGKVAAGIPIEEIEDVRGYEEIPEDMANHGQYFCLEIKGDSMEPRMVEGDIVVVKVQNTAETGDVVIAQVNGNEATCKKLLISQSGLSLLSLNPKYDPMVFTAEDVENKPVRIIGKVVELRAKF